jgi:hypothetical protein
VTVHCTCNVCTRVLLEFRNFSNGKNQATYFIVVNQSKTKSIVSGVSQIKVGSINQ